MNGEIGALSADLLIGNSGWRGPASLRQLGPSGMINLASSISYDKRGNMLNLALGNGLTEKRSYDAGNLISSMIVPRVMRLNYLHDPAKNITAISDLLQAERSKAYAYDPLNRLASAKGPWGIESFAYDANGNRLSENINDASYAYSYERNRLSGVSAERYVQNYQYDQSGNPISDGALDYAYGQNNRLSSVSVYGRIMAQYVYNAKGQRVVKTSVRDRDGDWDRDDCEGRYTVFHYDLLGRLIEETSEKGDLMTDYIYLGRNPLAMVKKEGCREETYFYHNDHLGAPQVMTDEKQMVVWTADLDPFGGNEPHYEMASMRDDGRGGRIKCHEDFHNRITNNLRFPGQYFDKETGLNYNYFRYYDPRTGRYTQVDPIGLKGGMNPYVYVKNNPINRMDPFGLDDFNNGLDPFFPPPWDPTTDPYANDHPIPPPDYSNLLRVLELGLEALSDVKPGGFYINWNTVGTCPLF